MKELKLPIIKEAMSKAKVLSMNEYFKFVQFNLKQAFNKKAYTKWKKMLIVDVPFSLK
jgi:hypothetical protein